MRAVLIDDDVHSLRKLAYLLAKNNVDIIATFSSPFDGYNYIVREKPDIVFLDVDLPDIDGLKLGVTIHKSMPLVSLVYVTSYSQYSLKAYEAHPVDYILKPIDEERLKKTVEFIRRSLRARGREQESNLKIKCFGRFEMLNGKKPVKFTTAKAQELLAFLICNVNRVIDRNELMDLLFDHRDEKKRTNHFRVTLCRLRKSLAAANIKREQLVITNDCAIQIAEGICDYVDFSNFLMRNKSINCSNADQAMKIIDSYQQDLLIDIDALWVMEFREYIAVQAEELMHKTAMYYTAISKFEQAEKILIKLVEMNSVSELGWMSLLDLYIKADMPDKYTYYYRRYAKFMYEELNMKPDSKYTELYNSYTT